MSSDIRICFVGDSFVNGTGDEAALGWAGRLCAGVNGGGTQLTYYNLGIRRDTSEDILRRWRQECERRLPASAEGRIVFSFGVNDTVLEAGTPRIAPDHSVANLRQLLREAATYPLLLVGPPPVSDPVQNERIRVLSDAYAREAAAAGVPFVELLRPLLGDEHYLREIAGNDGSHPQGSGYARMATLIGAAAGGWFSD